MTFLVNTFEINPSEADVSFAFHEKIGEGRELYFLAKFSSDTDNAKTLAESIFGAIVDTFEDAGASSAYDIFEESLKMANAEIEKHSSLMKNTPEIVVGFFDFHNLYLTQSGEAEVYLLREGSLSQITEQADEGILFSNILSGEVMIHDTLLISTTRLLRSITNNQLLDIFDQHEFQESVSLLKHELRTKTDENILLSVIGIGQQEIPEKKSLLSKLTSKKNKKDAPPIEKMSPDPTKEEIPHPQEAPQATPQVPGDPREKNTVSPSVDEAASTSPPVIEAEQKPLLEEDVIPQTPEQQPALDNAPPHDAHDPQTIHPPRMAPIKAKKRISLGKLKTLFRKDHPQKKLLWLLFLVPIVLGIVLTVNVVQQKESEVEADLRQKLSIARNAVQRSNELLFQGDRKGAHELLKTAEKATTDVFNSSFKELRSEAKFLKADIEAKKLEAENAIEANPQLVANLEAKNSNLRAQGMKELRGNFYVYDSTTIYKTIRNLVENGVGVTNQEVITASAVRSDQDTLLFLTSTPRVIEYKNGIVTPMNTNDKSWQKGVDIDTYGSRYTYILDPLQNQIWKYERRRADYSEAIAYNKTADLSRAVSMSIDGNIFILSDDGSIQKLFRGENVSYSFRDLPSLPFSGKNLRLTTTPESDFLYILDPDNRRILIFQKGERFATYKKQVLFNEIADAVDFYINDSGQKVNLLTTNKIYEFNL